MVNTHSRCIAVLDDDIRFIRMVERVLDGENISIQPITTVDLEEAVRVVAQSGCEMAIVDIFMYDHAAGFTLIEMLRAEPATAELPILVASGAHREIGKRFAFLQEHNCDVLLKPFGIDELIDKVRYPALAQVRPAGEEPQMPVLLPPSRLQAL